MTESKLPGRPRLRDYFRAPRIVRRFHNSEKGTTAIEFAMLAAPFFVLLFGIIESSLIFFAGQMLESSVDEVARKVRTGQLNNTITAAQFRTEVCNSAAILFDCDGIKIDVKVAAKFQDLGNPPIANGTNNSTDFSAYGFTAPCPEEIAMVTASYEWPIFTYFAADNIYPQSRGANNSAFRKILLNAVSVFRTEPYPAGTGGRAC
ncbi:MAG: pilus assembly protein [Nitratireductor sp.]|jgi:Flp pilus assembly protein TadG|nr:pilus assembly protein [Nitratireductor sp.]